MKASLVLLRHGQTIDNIKHVDTGRNDIALTRTGKKEARAAGPLIADIHFDKVYSSPLSRAFNTAQLALKSSKTQKHLRNTSGSWQIEKRQEIIEVDDGILNGRNMGDPLVTDYFEHAVFDGAPPGGESEKDLVARVQAFYEEEVIPRLKRGENVLLVAHTGTIRALHIAMGISERPEDGKPWTHRERVPNAGPNVHEYEDGVLKKSYDIENPVTEKIDARLKKAQEKKKDKENRKKGPKP